jgi:hypothetical protein
MELLLFLCFVFLAFFLNVSNRRNYQIMGVDSDTDTDTEE